MIASKLMICEWYTERAHIIRSTARTSWYTGESTSPGTSVVNGQWRREKLMYEPCAGRGPLADELKLWALCGMAPEKCLPRTLQHACKEKSM